MTLFEHIIIWVGVASVIFGVVAGGIALRAIFTHRDREYRIKYEEFLRQKQRVEDQIKQDRNSMTF